MTRSEAYEHYNWLKKTGKLWDFRKKTKSQLSGKDLELFSYADGDVMYNPFSGTMDDLRMTREEAYEHYEYLKRTGKFEEFRKKTKSYLSGKDLALFFYDDGEIMYNPFSGTMDEIHPLIDDDDDDI